MTNNKKQRKRNMNWFNPPYNKNIKTNIAQIFLNLKEKHFQPHHQFYKLFNKNTAKISYSCIGNIINSHNAKVLFPKKWTQQKTCSSVNKSTSPLEQKWFAANIVHKAKVASSNQNYWEKLYFSLCESTLKSNFPITKYHLIYMNIKMKHSYQIKSGEKRFGPRHKSWMGNNVFHITNKQNAAYCA